MSTRRQRFERKNMPGKGANTDPKVRAMRSAKTKANYKYGMGGLPKGDGHKPKPVTLPKMPWDKEPRP